jgi:protein-L-isoaspartate(D-aspartate) O-methyltransferase
MYKGKDKDRYAENRREMVERQIKARGIRDERVLDSMREVPRHLFVPPSFGSRAYDDTPLPTSEGQTISQPYIVAWMTELLGLEGDEVVLEVGTGSGYQAAILCRLAKYVYTVERIASLARSAEEKLSSLGIDNFEVIVGDGTQGFAEHAPYGAIMVTAGAPGIPAPLVEQLEEGGRMVIPVGPSSLQVLTLVERKDDRVITTEMGSCVFVPLVGRDGWER